MMVEDEETFLDLRAKDVKVRASYIKSAGLRCIDEMSKKEIVVWLYTIDTNHRATLV